MQQQQKKPSQQKQAPKKPAKPTLKNERSRGYYTVGQVPQWTRAVLEPFSTPPCGIPDPLTAPTMKAKSITQLAFTTSDAAATPTTQHGMLILVSSTVNAAAITGSFGFNTSLNAFVNAGSPELVPPNYGALFPSTGLNSYDVTGDDYRYRCTAMGVRLTYNGTELNRGGRVVVGLIEPDFSSGANDVFYETFGNSGVNLQGTLNPGHVIKRMSKYKIFRELDCAIEFESIPSGCPLYIPATTSNGASVPGLSAISTCNKLPVIAIMVTGDTTAAASAVGNSFDVEIIRHWEIICPSDIVNAIPMTPSYSNARDLDLSLNIFGRAYLEFPVKSIPLKPMASQSYDWNKMKRRAAAAAAGFTAGMFTNDFGNVLSGF